MRRGLNIRLNVSVALFVCLIVIIQASIVFSNDPGAPVMGGTLEMYPLESGHDDDSFIPPLATPASILQGFESYGDRLFANRPGARAGERPFGGPPS
jgi:hypothetical protein